ncbi:hypothetical protein BUALT_Bualt19G0043800 [Buddleja alternifolia]|uniref:Transposase MuDR plant domain-containing protein n=1 Tax=Buddleja alternifolia TaxID=168488 RepID=A0AAV6W589_9LAMI|nr:hypothetical protein BUALT_Bualt19G0043800 [Buddleja alternifolia]
MTMYEKAGGTASVVKVYYKLPDVEMDKGIRQLLGDKECLEILRAYKGKSVVPIYVEDLGHPLIALDLENNIISVEKPVPRISYHSVYNEEPYVLYNNINELNENNDFNENVVNNEFTEVNENNSDLQTETGVNTDLNEVNENFDLNAENGCNTDFNEVNENTDFNVENDVNIDLHDLDENNDFNVENDVFNVLHELNESMGNVETENSNGEGVNENVNNEGLDEGVNNNVGDYPEDGLEISVIETEGEADPTFDGNVEAESESDLSDISVCPSWMLEDLEGLDDDDIFATRPPNHGKKLLKKLRDFMKHRKHQMAEQKQQEAVEKIRQEEQWYSDVGEEDELQSLVDSDKEDLGYKEWYEGMDMREFEMSVGMKYRDKLRDWAVRKGWDFKFIKNERKAVTAICKKGCDWKIHAYLVQGSNTYQVKSLRGNHICAHITENNQANYKYIGMRIEQIIRDNLWRLWWH